MTEKERQEIINIVHRTVLGFFDPSLDEERYLTETEKTLLEVNKAICNSIEKIPTAERPHGEWEFIGENLFMCTKCGYIADANYLEKWKAHTFDSNFPNFCPNCGSDNRQRENNSSSMIINGKYSENVEYGTRVEIQKRR